MSLRALLLRRFSSSASPSLSPVLGWKCGKAIIDLQHVHAASRPKLQSNLYERFLVQYSLHDHAPSAVMEFFFNNKPEAIERTTMQYNVMLHAALFQGYGESQKVLEMMKKDNVHEDAVTNLFLITSFCKNGKIDKAVECFNRMKTLNLLPTRSHYSNIIVGYAMLDKDVEAEKWLVDLKTFLVDVDPYNLTILEALQSMYTRLLKNGSNPNFSKRLEEISKSLKFKSSVRYWRLKEEARGVQWSFPKKPVTSTGADDKGSASAPKGTNAPKKNATKK